MHYHEETDYDAAQRAGEEQDNVEMEYEYDMFLQGLPKEHPYLYGLYMCIDLLIEQKADAGAIKILTDEKNRVEMYQALPAPEPGQLPF